MIDNESNKVYEPLKITWIEARANMAGGQKSNRLIAEAMVRRGHEVTIAFVSKPKPWPPPWRIWRFSKRLREWLIGRGRQHHHFVSSSAKLISIGRNPILADDVPDSDVLISTWWETREWIDDWPDSKGRKAYFVRGHELHGGDPDRVKMTYVRPGLKLVNSTWLQRLMATEYGDRNTVLVPNGVDREQFDSSPREKKAVPTIGMLYGRQTFKGADTAFDCLRRVRERFPDLRTVAFGSTRVLREHNAPTWLEFQLRPKQERIADIYRQTDCWIVPSTTEGFGMPGLEAAACRCPIVSTRCGGPEDYVRDGENGYLVPVGDAEAMAEAVIRVLEQPPESWRAMSEASYRISREFDWDRSAEILEKALYQYLK